MWLVLKWNRKCWQTPHKAIGAGNRSGNGAGYCAFVPVIGYQLLVIGFQFLHESPLRLSSFAPSLSAFATLRQLSVVSCQSLHATLPLFLCAFVPLCLCAFVPLFSPLCQLSAISYQLSDPSRVSPLPFVPLCLPSVPSLSAFVPLCLCAFPQCLCAFVPLFLCAFPPFALRIHVFNNNVFFKQPLKIFLDKLEKS